ncbi:MAG TPA: hypothetical protein VLG27_01540 [Candidatus Saccharimonadia bacterium]|nr:hypothetical protein [Candidatus Saccharimonadia bacterium]
MAKTEMPPRNDKLFDRWSALHFTTGIILGWLINPWIALLIMAAYEPIENFVLCPLFWRFGIVFGHESWRNSFSDIFFDALGISLGALLLSAINTPSHLL